MIKKISGQFVLVLLAIALSGCGMPKEITVPVEGSRTIGVRKGQILKIELEANATTGYLWTIASTLDKGVLTEMGKYRYIHKSRRIGAGGIQLYRFEAVKKGKEAILFEYVRPWEKDKEPAKKYTIKVIVT